jgi:methionyl-tRNA formyltransferase
LRVVFFGSPEFAVPTLQSLATSPEFEVALVVTQASKGTSPVEVVAARLGLPV